MSSVISRKERGIAMLIVLFSLLLLSVVGLGMMYSTNMETVINSNYRDKQGVFYAALAGLQEARDRLHTTTTGSITPPTGLPTNGAANVIYIVADAATIKPWDPSNRYFDTELCQENVFGLSHTTGVPCDGSDYTSNGLNGVSWRAVKDNSLSASAPWNSTSLDWKWTRITMKGNNMTPWPVDGTSSSTAQVCWEGTHQMSTPYGTSTGCTPVGGVTSIIMVTTGTGYTSVPSVTIASVDGKGSGATATANITA